MSFVAIPCADHTSASTVRHHRSRSACLVRDIVILVFGDYYAFHLFDNYYSKCSIKHYLNTVILECSDKEERSVLETHVGEGEWQMNV